MNSHVIKAVRRNRGQCKCLWCGRAPAAECPVTPEIKAALKQYATEQGRLWKSRLRHEWETGGYGLGALAGPLMTYRNTAGPSALAKLNTARVLRS